MLCSWAKSYILVLAAEIVPSLMLGEVQVVQFSFVGWSQQGLLSYNASKQLVMKVAFKQLIFILDSDKNQLNCEILKLSVHFLAKIYSRHVKFFIVTLFLLNGIISHYVQYLYHNHMFRSSIICFYFLLNK